MFNEVKFVKSITSLNGVPKVRLPELVLCGRSNVGKSSFINSYFQRKKLAKISSTPGKTRTINYYLVDGKFYIVDLPGFGYARVSIKERNEWQKMIEEYLSGSGYIANVIHLIDSRHEPTKLDLTLNNYLKELDLPYTLLLTKTDKLKQSELTRSKKVIKKQFNTDESNGVIYYSSVTGFGRKEVYKLLVDTFN
ncbi:MAG: YihA family ribosome biogenesis GTP-binding protein [Melioribacteraceae bacterium]|nr:YihA family ribosome biogenesis GTP-binding protein [Melioribacteraceae bacterium]